MQGVKVSTIHDFLTFDIQANERLVNKYINDSAAELEEVQAKIFSLAFEER